MPAKEYKSRNAARRAAKKEKKGQAIETVEEVFIPSGKSIVDITADIDIDDEFKSVFSRFETTDEPTSNVRLIASDEKGEVFYDDDDNIPDESDDEPQISKTKLRKQSRLNVAELKQLVKKPEVVEWTDVSAPDPKLLVALKSMRNCVPVPAHWSQKKDYLAGSRGVQKHSFELPDYIRSTGVGEMRQAAQEQRENQSLKQQMRARVQPKMGRLDIDYQKLHDAFFRFQTKPLMTRYGETFFEGKEFETTTRQKRPGDLSDQLRDALNIPPGAPPPWLILMQRYGPPPSYPALKIPGLNAPIPQGAQWGFHPGGWGKPPTDEHNRPLYGDVFGTAQAGSRKNVGEKKEIEIWGELEEAADESESEPEEEEEEEEEEEDAAPEPVPDPVAVPEEEAPDYEVEEHIELRKNDVNRPQTLYQIIPEQQQPVKGFYGSSHSYAVPSSKLGEETTRKRHTDDVNVALDPDAIETMSKDQLEQHYDRARAEKSGKPASWDQDLSDMVSEQAAQSAKRQKRVDKKEKFKF